MNDGLAASSSGTKRVLLVAGEASGDLHAAALVLALRKLDTTIEVSGVGGQHLRAAGMQILVDTAHVATMGFTETFGTLGRLLSTYRRLLRFLDEHKPRVVILVDYPEFNMLLARAAKRRGIRVFYFIGPQVWAWRRGRVRKIVERIDRMAVVFPFEPELYNVNGRSVAEFVGHPLLDRVRVTASRAETLARHGLDPTKRTLALLPGSRKKEVRHLLAPSIAAAQRLIAEDGWQAIVALAPTVSVDELRATLGRDVPIPVAVDDTYNVVAAADAALVTSGTATLETVLLGCPMVIMYRVSPVTFAVARRLVHLDYIGMPNIILGRAVFPELLQRAVTPDALVAAVRGLAARHEEHVAALATVRSRLGTPGAAQRAAAMVLELVS
ncbi:MAG: lipid-A-disaccharide synthase [Deltaproteobacteria bacterium]|nr:lipid-A-disaccharide synthase [Deltaproteobacteria bacterium]MBI3387303.1 lipid-A-disaccharide synthase [Deltaproteobacteria bacterium]